MVECYLSQKLEEKLAGKSIPEIEPKITRPRISIRKPLLQQVKEKGHKNFQNLSIEKLKELAQREPIKRILKKDLIEQAVKMGIDVKKSNKKSFITDLIEKHGEFKTFKKSIQPSEVM